MSKLATRQKCLRYFTQMVCIPTRKHPQIRYLVCLIDIAHHPPLRRGAQHAMIGKMYPANGKGKWGHHISICPIFTIKKNDPRKNPEGQRNKG